MKKKRKDRLREAFGRYGARHRLESPMYAREIIRRVVGRGGATSA